MKYEPEVWRKAYREAGFVVIPDLLDLGTLSTLRDGMERITQDVESLPAHLREKIFFERDHLKNNPQWYAGKLTPEECGGRVRQIADLALFGPAFAELICYPPLLDVLEALFESPEFSFTLLVGRPKAAHVGNGVNNGNFHRDTPHQNYTSANVVQAILCLDGMTAENGPTAFIPGSHKVSDEEAGKMCWGNVAAESLSLERKIVACCPAGSGVFFTSKILHAAGHNRSDRPRRTINAEWAGPGVLPTSPARFAYQGLKPRSRDPRRGEWETTGGTHTGEARTTSFPVPHMISSPAHPS